MASEPLVQVTDTSGAVIGAVDMLEAFKQELIRHTAYVMITNSKREFLLQKRSIDAHNYSGYWDPSAGGHIDEGEAPEAAAYRELEEELGVAHMPLRHVASFYFESEGDGRTYRYYAHVYVGVLAGDELPTGLSDEVSEVALYDRDTIATLGAVTPITRHIISLL